MRFNKVMTMDKQEKHLGSVPEDIEDTLRLIEKSYDIKFEANELGHVRTFGQLTDHIISKIKLDDKNDCTDQQAFYKLRTSIEQVKGLKTSTISPMTHLTELFPRQSRKIEISKIEKQLAVDLKVLRPRHAVTYSLIILLVLSIVGLFIKWQFGVIGLVVSISGLWASEKMGKEFKDKTLGELTDRMTQLNYTKSRRQPGTMNTKEVKDKIEKLFVDNLGLEEKTIDRDTVIV
jgi:acyl carrier protein